LVHVEDHFATDIDDLWSAITRPDRLARWIGQVHGDLRVGGVFHARFTSTWEGDGRVDACEPPNRLLLTMSPGQEDQRVIEAWLSPVDDGTLLVVEERGLPVGELPSYGAGWQAHLEDLAAHLAGAERADWRSRWSELAPLYRDMVEGPRERAERASLMTFLDAQRHSVLAILDGLEDNDLRRPVVPSGWTPLGVVEHLGHAERLWFQIVLTGRCVPLPWPDEGGAPGGPFTTQRPAGDVLAFYRDQCAIADAALSRTPLMAASKGKVPPELVMPEIATTRDIVLHMIEETARHAGHLDLARELIDGRTGLGPR
jgi:uncharacterized protein YndB with AHSA1/START domain